MAVDGLLIAIQERAAARGMTLAALARASGMQPSNLRRMLKSTTASPQLGSVMRLLAPLRCRIGPAGAAVPAELAAFLDGLRQSRGVAWEQLLPAGDVHGAKLAAVMMPDPERLPLDLVMRLADALEATLVLVDAEPTVTTPAGARGPRRPRARVASRDTQPVTGSRRASPPISTPPTPPAGSALLDARPRITPLLQVPLPSPSPSPPPPRSYPCPPPASSGLSPLRPPRLGRYRDAPPEPVQPRPLLATWTPSPRTSALEVALFERIADLSVDDLRESIAIAGDSFGKLKSIPLSVVAGLARLLQAGFKRRSRPPSPPMPEPSAGCFDALDPIPLCKRWMASKHPNDQATDSQINYDSLGMLAIHVALNPGWAVSIRLAASGQAHRLFAVLGSQDDGEIGVHSQPDSPLEIHVNGELHAFRHVRSGPVFGELEVRGRVYLVAAVSALLVLIEVCGAGVRVVWGGRPERLREVMVEIKSSTDKAKAEAPSSAEPPSALAVLRAQLATTAADCTEPDTAQKTTAVERTRADEAGGEAASRAEPSSALDELRAQLAAVVTQARDPATAKKVAVFGMNRTDEAKREVISNDEPSAALTALRIQLAAAVGKTTEPYTPRRKADVEDIPASRGDDLSSTDPPPSGSRRPS